MTAPIRSSNTLRMLLVIAGIVLAGGVLFAWSRILFPVLVGFLIAWISHPLAVYFEKQPSTQDSRFPAGPAHFCRRLSTN